MNIIDNILSDIACRELQRLEHASDLSIGLLAGDLGSVIYLYEYSRINTYYQSFGDKMLDKLLSNLQFNATVKTYCNGVAGMVIGLYALKENGFIDDFSPLLGDIDYYIESSLDVMLQYNNHDFLHGFIGLGFYWIKRYQSSGHIAIRPLVKIIEHLKVGAEHDGNCIKWPIPESRLSKKYNISLSHGYSSTIILLCRMLEIPELRHSYGHEIEMLISGAVNYILCNRLDKERFGCWFASSSLECEQAHRSRLAWCYGDLGVSIALYYAGQALNDDNLAGLSCEVLEYAGMYRRNLEQNYVNDACLCHGAAGIGLIFREMSQIFSSQILANTADYWRRIVLNQVIEKRDGFSYSFYDVKSRSYQDKTSLLEGTVGVAMYLLNEIIGSSLPQLLLITK